ncbi:hypothetical protein B5X24_HaOG202777 [Helicoverpa armigera]|uniref:Uncharacterized protein n=1 Tax=Helicoverpa armigera TaxID=29058 RepID=A0A2W1BYZ4_HELAM|nr:hypothetical protein B5X24_HaOG202777 [Helicoverpa armigera]
MHLRIILAALIITLFLTSCEAAQHWFQNESSENEQRSMASAVMDYLDLLFPKDDDESMTLKWVFSMLTDNESILGGMTELMT